MEQKVLLVLHALSATIWVGSLLIMTLGVLPKALKEKNIQRLIDFEDNFKILTMISITIQMITGLRMAMLYAPMSQWFATDNNHSYYIQLKLMLLLITLLTYIFNRVFIVKKASNEYLKQYAVNLVILTIVAVFIVLVGLSFRANIV